MSVASKSVAFNVTPGFLQYFLKMGLEEGDYSDVTVKAFGKEYKLHKLVLGRISYFKAMMEWPSPDSEEADDGDEANESNSKNPYLELELEEYMDQQMFEIVLARVYGSPNVKKECKSGAKSLAAGDFFWHDGYVALVKFQRHFCSVRSYIKCPKLNGSAMIRIKLHKRYF
ncbi:unnamed protein product [Ambrosiozyma monospora]|uniref:Unnamed protein product n=1 Tax=Ambrosiozyma monospora TaxID=43982 RepID=A0ACB5STE0_AMBMO|nr:unnamed protein product [Ambrosiozyma monospora]